MARRGDVPPSTANPLGSLAEQIAAARRIAEGKIEGDMPSDQYRYLVGRVAVTNGLPLPGTNRGGNPVPRAHMHRRGTPDTGFNIRAVAEVLTDNGYDPAEEMVKILQGEADPNDPGQRLYRVDTKTRLQFANELLKYVHPQRKAVDVEQRVQYSGAELDAQLGSALGRLLAMGDGAADNLIAEALRTVEEEAGEPAPPMPGAGAFDPWSMI